MSPLERARRFYVRARQVRTGLAQTATLGRWANCKQTSRRGMSGVISRWLGGVEFLPDIAERLLRVQIENRPALEVIELYDSPNTLFYCDPPYLHETRGDSNAYSYEMTNTDHIHLAEVLNSLKGLAAMSNMTANSLTDYIRKNGGISIRRRQKPSIPRKIRAAKSSGPIITHAIFSKRNYLHDEYVPKYPGKRL